MGKLSGIPVWCFTGPELGEKEKEIQNILSEVRAEFGTVDEYSFYPEETPVPQIVQILLNGSLFSAGKFIVVNEAHTIKKKEEISLIKTWLDGRITKTQDTQLIFTSSEISLDKKLESLIPKEHQKIFWELQEQKKESWLVSFFQKKGLILEKEGARTILELVENNTKELETKCLPLTLFFSNGETVTSEKIEEILSHNKEETVFTLFEKMTRKDFASAIETAQKLLETKETSGIQIIAGLNYCFKRLKDFHKISEAGTPTEFDLKRNGFTSRKAREQYSRAAGVWSKEETFDIISRLTETDNNLRTSGMQTETTEIFLLIYSILKKKGAAIESPVYPA